MSLKQKCCLQGHYGIDPMLALTPQQKISEDLEKFLQGETPGFSKTY